MTEPLLKVTNLRQHFKISRSFTVKAVNGVSFEIYELLMFKITETHSAATWLLHPDAPKIDLPPELKSRLMRVRKAAHYD